MQLEHVRDPSVVRRFVGRYDFVFDLPALTASNSRVWPWSTIHPRVPGDRPWPAASAPGASSTCWRADERARHPGLVALGQRSPFVNHAILQSLMEASIETAIIAVTERH